MKVKKLYTIFISYFCTVILCVYYIKYTITLLISIEKARSIDVVGLFLYVRF